MMAKSKDDRHQSPTELLEDLARVMAGKKARAAPPLRRDRTGTTARRRVSAQDRSGERRAESRRPKSHSAVRAMTVREGGPTADRTPLVLALVVSVVVVVVLALALAGGDLTAPSRPSIIVEGEAEVAYDIAEGQYQQARGGDAISENGALLRTAFQRVIDRYPNTEGARRAKKRLEELK
jgi:hypothetical protein